MYISDLSSDGQLFFLPWNHRTDKQVNRESVGSLGCETPSTCGKALWKSEGMRISCLFCVVSTFANDVQKSEDP